MLGLRQSPDLFSALYGPQGRRVRAALPAPTIVEAPEPDVEAPGRVEATCVAPASTAMIPSGATPTIEVTALPNAQYQIRVHDGEKFPGGFGPTLLLETDYWTLRARSAHLYKTNLFARGLIRKMVTNEVNSGLNLECTPEETILGRAKGNLDDWSEDVENRFALWANNPRVCDVRERHTFGQLQAIARRESLVVGDVLVTLQQHPRTGMPRVKLISGAAVQTPIHAQPQRGNIIVHGVEIDRTGRQVAYWVRQAHDPTATLEDALTFKRIPAYGEKTGRRIGWLLYGTDKRLDDIRGEPMFALMMQSLRDIDRYRDSILRKAVINSLIAGFLKKKEDKPGSHGMFSGAVRNDAEVVLDSKGQERTVHVSEHIPGLFLHELQTGEEPVAFNAQVGDEKLGDFERVILGGVSVGNEMPPEIFWGEFNSNYSASQAAIHQYKIYLRPIRVFFAAGFCQPIYEEFFAASVTLRKILAPGFREAWKDLAQYDVSGAWLASDWAGQIVPSLKFTDAVKAYEQMVMQGFITRDHASRELTGTKYSKNVKRLRIENEQLAHAREPLQALETAPPEGAPEEPEGNPDAEDEEESNEE